jgi:hypothetical protein
LLPLYHVYRIYVMSCQCRPSSMAVGGFEKCFVCYFSNFGVLAL